jgi:hypothetical protein
MQRLEVSGAVRPIYGSLGAKGLKFFLVYKFIKGISLGLGTSIRGCDWSETEQQSKYGEIRCHSLSVA